MTCPTVCFEDTLVRDAGVYVSKIIPKRLKLTCKAELTTDISDSDRFVTLKVNDDIAGYIRAVEAQAVEWVVEKKDTFLKEGVDEQTVRDSSRAFVSDSGVHVRVSEDLACWSEDFPVAGDSIECVLTASRITICKSEFGIVWTLRQMLFKPEPVDPADPEDPEPGVPEVSTGILEDADVDATIL